MSETPDAGQRSTPTRSSRAWAYALAWLPPLGVLFWYLPRFGVMFQKLDEKGDLPALVHWALTLVRFNQAYYYLPAVVGLVSAVIAAEALLCVLCWARQERLGVLAWWLWVGCVGLFAWLLALAPPMLAHTMKSWGVVS